jgi:cytochrome c-type biogenesis protein CcmE
MTHPRKRQVRLVVSLTLAVLLASGLVYTSFAASDPALTPSQLLSRAGGGNVQLTGTVVKRSITHKADGIVDFRLADRAGDGVSVPVVYSGSVPSVGLAPGRELIVSGRLHDGAFDAQPGSMITKCPSKYSAAPS